MPCSLLTSARQSSFDLNDEPAAVIAAANPSLPMKLGSLQQFVHHQGKLRPVSLIDVLSDFPDPACTQSGIQAQSLVAVPGFLL